MATRTARLMATQVSINGFAFLVGMFDERGTYVLGSLLESSAIYDTDAEAREAGKRAAATFNETGTMPDLTMPL